MIFVKYPEIFDKTLLLLPFNDKNILRCRNGLITQVKLNFKYYVVRKRNKNIIYKFNLKQ